MDEILKFFEKDRYAKLSNIEVVSVSPGKATATMEVEEMHLNGVGTVHGGALFTLGDFTFALAANSHGTVAVAINANISYLKAIAIFQGMAYRKRDSIQDLIAKQSE